MRKYVTLLIALLAFGLLGAKSKEGWPACSADRGPHTFTGFMQAIARQDDFAIEFYMTQRGCGSMKGNIKTEILETKSNMVRVRIHPEGQEPSEIWTVRSALTE
jgi:hypothetical protein